MCFISVTLKISSGRKILDPTTYIFLSTVIDCLNLRLFFMIKHVVDIAAILAGTQWCYALDLTAV